MKKSGRPLLYLIVSFTLLGVAFAGCKLLQSGNRRFHDDFKLVSNEIKRADQEIRGLGFAGTEEVPTPEEIKVEQKLLMSLRSKVLKLKAATDQEERAKKLLLLALKQLDQATNILMTYSATKNREDFYRVEDKLEEYNKTLAEAESLVYNVRPR